jgi:hypothetical protein
MLCNFGSVLHGISSFTSPAKLQSHKRPYFIKSEFGVSPRNAVLCRHIDSCFSAEAQARFSGRRDQGTVSLDGFLDGGRCRRATWCKLFEQPAQYGCAKCSSSCLVDDRYKTFKISAVAAIWQQKKVELRYPIKDSSSLVVRQRKN